MSEENKIVAANFADNKRQPQPEQAQQPAPTPRLSTKLATEMGGALDRLQQLKNSNIVTPTSEAEVKGLIDYLANNLLTYAPELLATWFVVRNEYEPAINALATVLSRVDGVHRQRARLRAEAEQCATAAQCCGQCENKQ